MKIRPRAAVIGTVFIDYKGFTSNTYNPAGRNLGRVEIVPGGVARNVAVNMAHLDVETWFVGTLNEDGSGEALKKKMAGMGVHFEYASFVPHSGTGAWLALIGHDGELLGSVSHMPDAEVMRNAIMAQLPGVLEKIDGILLEVDLSEVLAREIIAAAQAAQKKIYALPGNFSVIGKNFDLFQYMECFVCNETEAERLLGRDFFSSEEELHEMAKAFAQKYSLKNFVITLGEKGSLYINLDGTCGRQRSYPATVIDSTGAGDSFFSGTVAALMHGRTLAEAVDLGAKIASFVVADQNSDCSSLDILNNEIYKGKLLEWVNT